MLVCVCVCVCVCSEVNCADVRLFHQILFSLILRCSQTFHPTRDLKTDLLILLYTQQCNLLSWRVCVFCVCVCLCVCVCGCVFVCWLCVVLFVCVCVCLCVPLIHVCVRV